MLDGFKIYFKDLHVVKKLHNNWRLVFVQHTNTQSGEILYYTAEYKGLKIKTFTSGLIEIKGSFHKFHNGGFHNHNDFTLKKMHEVINTFKIELDIDASRAHVSNLEFGVNVNPLFSPNALLNALMAYKWYPFNDMVTLGQGYGRERKFNQYSIKIYNKGLQYHQPDNILRIEKKIVSMSALNFGKIKLSDLTNPALWQHCKTELTRMFQDILINEPIDIKLLKKNEQRIYNTVVNQSNWIELSPDQRKRYKRAFNNIIITYGKHHYQSTVLKLINTKCVQLSSV